VVCGDDVGQADSGKTLQQQRHKGQTAVLGKSVIFFPDELT